MEFGCVTNVSAYAHIPNYIFYLHRPSWLCVTHIYNFFIFIILYMEFGMFNMHLLNYIIYRFNRIYAISSKTPNYNGYIPKIKLIKVTFGRLD